MRAVRISGDAQQTREDYFRRIASKHGYDPEGPQPGEDEAPDPETLFD